MVSNASSILDDILITGSSCDAIAELIAMMSRQFAMKDLGRLHYFLDIQVEYNDTGMLLHQTKYATDLMKEAGLRDAKPALTPEAVHLNKKGLEWTTPYANAEYFRSLVGTLQYLTTTRPNIQHAVNTVCQKMHSPSQGDYALLKKILPYVAGTLNEGLQFKRNNIELHGFADSDWASDYEDRRSTSAYCMFLGDNLISWSSKKQKTIVRSSTDAEYRAMAHASAELRWLMYLLADLGVQYPTP